MNVNFILNRSIRMIESALGSPFGSADFNFLLAVFIVCILIVGLACNRWIGASTRGFIGTTIGILLPIIAAGIAFTGFPDILREYIPNPQTHLNALYLVTILTALLTLMIITPFFLGTGFIKSFIIFIITVSIAVSAVKFTKIVNKKYAVFSQEFHEKFD